MSGKWDVDPTFDLVALDDSSGGYNWSVGAILHRDGTFYTAYDSGCSCNWPWEDGVNASPVGSLAEALKDFSPQARERAMKWVAP